ncbi:hypothetical protein H9657_10330 [Cellulomonas sp. Sa3CUA2]|uniref:HEPN domain-containing protein n=1 Tax=Cellulomonas avistercoris TaxID=2762242 RepID=A0ABR8QEE5_9CELL|nr:hypothetical protein [Cellulomonas avistercoris]MBD7918669.1 hypothetical protein [Cellulomonas avistercoris]
MRLQASTPAVRAGRLAKARQFAGVAADQLELAARPSDIADAYVTLAVHAGIAAADAVCCARLGHYSRSESHHELVELLRSADGALARHLQTLLALKTQAGYAAGSVSAGDVLRAQRAMDALVRAAGDLP